MRPSCLVPIFITGVGKDGASNIPELEFPIKQIQF